MLKPTCWLLILGVTNTPFPSRQNLQDLPRASPRQPLSWLCLDIPGRGWSQAPGQTGGGEAGQAMSTEPPVTRARKHLFIPSAFADGGPPGLGSAQLPKKDHFPTSVIRKQDSEESDQPQGHEEGTGDSKGETVKTCSCR